MHPLLAKSAHEILDGQLNDGRNNILKSPQLQKIEDKEAYFIAEPYDYAFETNNIDNTWESYDRLERTMRRRRKKLFKAMNVDRISVTVYSDMEMLNTFYIIKE
ncbi:MAG: hypothetical protein L0J35_06485 [Tetragenococcus halophilus]|nr:hypothetical protein [Tetragenococcus halophilus]MDN6631131.1 hypothetical protein [Staphylococcus equorum]